MISPGMHYDAGLCRPAGGGSCSPAFRAAGSTTIVFYRQHVLKSMLKWSHPRMLSCGVLRVHDSQPRSSRMRKCLNVDLLSTQAYSCKCLSAPPPGQGQLLPLQLLPPVGARDRRARSSCNSHASNNDAAHACCGGASAPLPTSDTDKAKHCFKRSLFCRRTLDPSHTDATM